MLILELTVFFQSNQDLCFLEIVVTKTQMVNTEYPRVDVLQINLNSYNVKQFSQTLFLRVGCIANTNGFERTSTEPKMRF